MNNDLKEEEVKVSRFRKACEVLGVAQTHYEDDVTYTILSLTATRSTVEATYTTKPKTITVDTEIS